MIDIRFGDAYKLIKDIPDNSVDMIYTDPPYESTGLVYKKPRVGKYKKLQEMFDRFQNRLTGNQGVTEDGKTDLTKLYDGYNMEIYEDWKRVLKRINIMVWCNKKQLPRLLAYWYDEKTTNYDIILWQKTNDMPICGNQMRKDLEYLLWIRERGCYITDNLQDKHHIYTSSTNQKDKKEWGHPTIKPLEEVERHLRLATQEGWTILDPFGGSGTTAVACKRLNRNCITFEYEKKYYDIILKRLENVGQIATDTYIMRPLI